jgi:hypothetical protein
LSDTERIASCSARSAGSWSVPASAVEVFALGFGLLRMLATRLLAGGQALGLGQRLERLHRFELLRHDAEVDRLLREDRIYLQRGITLLLQIAGEAIEDEVA